jgi:hypothetical protein
VVASGKHPSISFADAKTCIATGGRLVDLVKGVRDFVNGQSVILLDIKGDKLDLDFLESSALFQMEVAFRTLGGYSELRKSGDFGSTIVEFAKIIGEGRKHLMALQISLPITYETLTILNLHAREFQKMTVFPETAFDGPPSTSMRPCALLCPPSRLQSKKSAGDPPKPNESFFKLIYLFK